MKQTKSECSKQEQEKIKQKPNEKKKNGNANKSHVNWWKTRIIDIKEE